ncbi:MAG: hypothetical protein ACREI7_01985 [Myxococcota bacterium]
MPFESSPLRLWKSLSKSEREQAARAFWEHPPEEAAPAAAREIVKLLRVRPQAFGKIALESRVKALAGLANPPDAVAEALVVALHLGPRRPLLVDFLDQLGVANEEGLISEETEVAPPEEAAVRQAAKALAERHDVAAIRVYWNALWLQDANRWQALEVVGREL